MCNKEVHELLIQNDNAINCIFCNKQIQDPGKPKGYFCCDYIRLCVRIVAKRTMNILLPEYVDFYENRHKIRKRSVYHRKCHIIMS